MEDINNCRDKKSDGGKKKTLNMGRFLFALVATCALGVVSLYTEYDGHLEPYHWPVFYAPLCTVLVGMMAFSDYLIDYINLMVDDKGKVNDTSPDTRWNVLAIILGTLASLAGMLFICFFLTKFHSWLYHLALMAGLFVVFLTWDLLVLWNTSEGRHRKQREQITAGSRLVNRPTLAAIIVASLLLWKFNMYPNDLGCRQLMGVDGMDTIKPNGVSLEVQDVFVAGLISFHLVVASVGYFSTMLGTIVGEQLAEEQRKVNRILRFLHWLLTKVPGGPQARN